jgi:polyphosphate kinase 2 (PPK2 family)
MLEAIDLERKLAKPKYKRLVPKLQDRLHQLQRAGRGADIGTIVVFEGWEACGKGAAIQQLTRRLEPRAMRLHATRAPRTHELPLPWLQRFWVATPAWGKIGIFDRSWYRRVLAERVDGVTSPTECENAYVTIRSFERMLTDDRYEIVKLFLHISEAEQQRRLEERRDDPQRTWMVTEKHWHRHAQYAEYQAAIELMFEHTETEWAPWTVVEANNERWSQVKVLRTVIDRMEAGLRRRGVELPSDGAEEE